MDARAPYARDGGLPGTWRGGRDVSMTGDRPRALARVSVTRAVALFLLAGLLVLLAVTALLAVAQRRVAVSEAIRDARTLTNLEAHDVVRPVLTDAALVPGTPEWAQLQQVVRERVLGTLIVRVKIWDESGRVVYSDDPTLVGKTFDLPADELSALRTGQTVAEVTDLNEPENVGEKSFGKLLQVYLGIRTPGGQQLLFETYQPYDTITVASRRMWTSSLPPLVGGLVLLYVVQAPLAYRMANRLRQSQDEREQLLVASLATSDRERTRIAADLHDGVVQGLAGASYTMSAAARTFSEQGQDEAADTFRRTALDLRRWVRELRSLIVTVTPPALHSQGLASSLSDLVATLESRGIAVTLDVAPLGSVPHDVQALAYRVAQEAARNIIRHADASTVSIGVRLEKGPGRALRTLLLTVTDDGRGFDPAAVSRRHGSVGLELLSSVVAAQGGTLQVTSHPDRGTTVELGVSMRQSETAPEPAPHDHEPAPLEEIRP